MVAPTRRRDYADSLKLGEPLVSNFAYALGATRRLRPAALATPTRVVSISQVGTFTVKVVPPPGYAAIKGSATFILKQFDALRWDVALKTS